MPDLNNIYAHQAMRYQQLVACEDYQNQLLPTLENITPLKNKVMLEGGAGTGRLTTLLAPLAAHITACDINKHMLDLCQARLSARSAVNWQLAAACHENMPFCSHWADVFISGWSFCYAAIDAGANWRGALKQALQEVKRQLKPDGIIILLESLGTGFEKPKAPAVLAEYLTELERHGFKTTWLRTDYCFDTWQQAQELITFFFGNDPLPLIKTRHGIVLPECTGIWWVNPSQLALDA